jgi:hypothetical protein
VRGIFAISISGHRRQLKFGALKFQIISGLRHAEIVTAIRCLSTRMITKFSEWTGIFLQVSQLVVFYFDFLQKIVVVSGNAFLFACFCN